MPAAPSLAEGRELFGQRLVRLGRITPTQLSEALVQQPASGKRLGAILAEVGALDARDLATELGAHLGYPTADLRQVELDPAALKLVPQQTARAANVIPLRIAGPNLQVAAADPLDRRTLESIANLVQRALEVFVAPASDIQRAIATSYRALVDVDSLVEKFQAADVVRQAETIAAAPGAGGEAPVVQLVNQIIENALNERASDVHVEPQQDRVRIRYRIDGALHDIVALPASIGPAFVSRIKIMGEMNIADRRRSQDGQVALRIGERDVDIRINTCPTVWGEKAVLRILDRTRVLYRLDELGMAQDTYAAFARLVRSPFGMVICAGPTGSGKTTTLYATLAEVNQTERNVTTIEDPVEYIIPSINQIEINEQAGLTFATGLRSILRQDPDIILVGEIRDGDTARIAVESALTGHLVLSSLHATDGASAVHRLMDLGIEPFLIASTVIGVSSQRLFRLRCSQCAVEQASTAEELAFYEEHSGKSGAELPPQMHGRGCNFCARTGFRDRIGVFELLRMTEPMKGLVLERASVDELRAAAQAEGTRSITREALRLAESQMSTIAEVMRVTYGG
ncbi:MAG: GspE/PulE family protein [Actinomycetota bacterium]